MTDLNRQIIEEALKKGDIKPEAIHAWAEEHKYTGSYVRKHIRDLVKSGCLVRYYVTEKGRSMLQEEREDE